MMQKGNFFEASENYWQNKADLFSNLYRTWNPMLVASRLFLKQRQDIISTFISGDKKATALDIGCGSGEFVAELAEVFGKVIGVDYSQMMLDIAKKNIKNPNVTFYKSDCTKLPIERNSVDQIFSLGLLDYVQDVDAALHEFSNVLKPGGTAVLTMPKSPSLFEPLRWSKAFRGLLFKIPPIVNIASKTDFEKMLRASGFELVELKSLWTTMWIVHVKKVA